MLQKLLALLILIVSLASGMSGSILGSVSVQTASGSAHILPVEPTETPIALTSTPVGWTSATPFETPSATSTAVTTDTLTAAPTLTPTPAPASAATPTPVHTPPSFPKSNPPLTKTPDVWTLACVEANRLLIKTLARLFFINQNEIIKWFCMSYRYSEIQHPGAVGANLWTSDITNPGILPVWSTVKLRKKPAVVQSGMPLPALEQSQKAVEKIRVLGKPSSLAASQRGAHFENSFPGKVHDAVP